MGEISRIKRVPVPRVKSPKACELDVKCRGLCVLRVKYQNFSCTKDQPPYAAPTATSTSDVTPSKTHYFQCFLIVQAPRMMTKLSPFLCCLSAAAAACCHHYTKISSIIHSICVGVTRCKPTQIVMRGERVMLSSGNFGCDTCTMGLSCVLWKKGYKTYMGLSCVM